MGINDTNDRVDQVAGFVVVKNEGRQQPDGSFSRYVDQDVSIERLQGKFHAGCIKLNADHESFPADFFHFRVVFEGLLEGAPDGLA